MITSTSASKAAVNKSEVDQLRSKTVPVLAELKRERKKSLKAKKEFID
jgi:hypothetical protein